jgi:hypothetical protein
LFNWYFIFLQVPYSICGATHTIASKEAISSIGNLLTAKESAIKFSPSINHLFLDGTNPEIRQQIWSSADIFISLADN